MPDTISFYFLHPTSVVVDGGPEGLIAVRLLEWARLVGPRGLIHVARSETRAERLVRALEGLAPALQVLILPPWDCLPYDRAGPSRHIMGRRIATLRRLAGATEAPRLLVTTIDAAMRRCGDAATGAPPRLERCKPALENRRRLSARSVRSPSAAGRLRARRARRRGR